MGEASSTVTDSSESSERFLKGPPDAVRTTEATDSGARPSRHWNTAECSLSTGSRSTSSSVPRCEREIARRNEALLVRERERDPVLERPERRADAGEAHHGVEHEIRLRRFEELSEVAADLHVLDPVARGELVERLRARRARTR